MFFPVTLPLLRERNPSIIIMDSRFFIDNMNTPADSFAKHAIYPYDTTYFVLSNDAD